MEKEVAEKIKEAGGNLYLVGGAIRDEIMGKEPHDRDYCVEGIELSDFIDLFPDAKIVGNDFSVFLIDGCEFALARTEKKVSKGYKGFKVNTSKDITIKEDLKRRDLTINAIAKNVLTGEIVDPFNGVLDIENRKIRHVSDAFDEDPLRAYRVARFAAKYDFDVVPETVEKLRNLKDELNTLTKERVFVELRKALGTDTPSKFFRVLKEANILDVHFKEINDLVGVPQPEKYHPEGDVFEHTMMVLDKVASKTPDESVRFAALVHDFGKVKTPKDILPRHIGHDEVAEEPIKNLCNRIKLPNVWKKKGIETASMHMIAAICKDMKPYKQAIFFNKVNRSSIGLDDLELIVNADDMTNSKEVKFADIAKETLNKVNGTTLMDKGITFEECGKEKFIHLLLEEQAKVISQLERQEKNNIEI